MWILLALACAPSAPTWPLDGDVLAVGDGRVEVRHDAIDGLMPEMVMTFAVEGGPPIRPGDRIHATLRQGRDGFVLTDVSRVGTNVDVLRDDVPPIHVGEVWPRTEAVAEDGRPLVLGEGQGAATALAFLYTRCPNPDFCPALVGRLLALQEELPDGARIVTVTLDPSHDTPEVLATYGASVGADPTRWRLAHTDASSLARLALRSGQRVLRRDDLVVHEHRLVVLDAHGAVIERYDHNQWAVARVVRQLATGSPVGLHPVSSSSPPRDPPR